MFVAVTYMTECLPETEKLLRNIYVLILTQKRNWTWEVVYGSLSVPTNIN